MKIEEIPLGTFRIKVFADFPWRLYRGDPYWTPPLRGDLLGNRLLGLVGLLTNRHPYHSHAEVSHFLAWRGREPVGRVSVAINHRFNNYYGVRLGFFGFRPSPQLISTLVTELIIRLILKTALRTDQQEPFTAPAAEFGSGRTLELTFRALHASLL